MKYANRESEYNDVSKYLQSHYSPVVIHAHHASGITSFVKNRLDNIYTSLYNSNVFYIDTATNKSLGEAILSCIIRSNHMNRLQTLVDEKIGRYGKTVLSAALEGVPYAGPLLGRLSEQRTAVPVYTGAYSSAIEEVLIPFFKETRGSDRFLIIVDAAEMILESSYELLVGLLRCDSIQFVLIRTQNVSQFDKLENFLFNHGINISFVVEFDRPKIKLIKEIGSLYGVSISTDEAKRILDTTNQNIHSIIKQIRSIKTESVQFPLSDFEKAIILLLHIWSEPMDVITLTELVISSEVFTKNAREETKKALFSLQERQIIACDNQGWILLGHHDPTIETILSNIADVLVYKNVVYNYLSCETAGKCRYELRYMLSKDLNCTTQRDARLYLRQLIIQGKEVPLSLFADSQLKKGVYDDSLLAGITYSRARKYQKAFEWIDSIPIDQRTSDIELLLASLLNRVRRSEDAEKALLKCLEENIEPSRQNLLRAFLVSTYIHMEKLSDAQYVYNCGKDLYPDSLYHGYLVRNAISAFAEYQGELYSKALSDFRRDGDDFGYYSTLCNQGYALCKNGNPHEGLILLNQAKDGLELFSQINLHILYNDIGLCYLLLDQYQDAHKYLSLAKSLAVNSVPRLFSTINIACTEAVKNQTENALLLLNSIEDEVVRHKLDRVRQQYYINRLLVEYLHGNKEIQPLIEKATAYPDRYNPEHTQYALRIYKQFMVSKKEPQHRRWKELFSPCGLVYWYMDPLKLLPEGII